MKSKRLLTLVTALCLMISVLAPSAGAVTVVSEESYVSENNITGIGAVDDLLASAAESLGIPTLRNDSGDLSYVNGQWIITDKFGESVELTYAQLPEHIQALRDAREFFDSGDTVAAFVVLSDDPTVEQYSNIADVPAAKTEALEAKQEDLVDTIEEEVLDGEELEIISQFTYLTNSLVVETAFSNLEAIAALDGVKSVFVSPLYYPCETSGSVTPYTVTSGNMTGVADVWQDLGYTGAGMTIAILDTGLDIDHPSFEAAPADPSWDLEWLQEKLDTLDLNAEDLYNGTLTAEDLYYSEKIPYMFNYPSGTTSVIHNDGLGDHGTHVAGIAAANRIEGVNVAGMAPDAQIIAMKVFNGRTGGSSMYDLIEALEDCMTLGVDVVNMSLGSPAGFCEANIEEIDSIFRRIGETDIIVDVAMGNEGTSMNGSLYNNYMFPTDHIDSSTASSPATYNNVMSVGSADNTHIYGDRFQLADDSNVFYMYSIEYLYGYVSFTLDALAGQEFEYVIVPGLGEEADFYDEDGNSIVDGKVAVIKRGTLNFGVKAFNATAAGAVAVLIWDNVEEDIFSFGMTTEVDGTYPDIPVVLISLSDGQRMADAEDKTMYVSDTAAPRPNSSGGQMSYFSCWGVAPNMMLMPDITGVGGSIYSCYDNGEYGIMSGTSMATPQVAGVTALVLQYLKEAYPDATEEQTRILVDSLLMSTAVTVIDSITGLEASPRQQGAGLANPLYAITAEAYLTVNGAARPKAEMGESADGTYSFTFTVHNDSDEARTYTLRSSLLCEDYAEDENYPGVYFMAATEHGLDNSAVSFSSNTVTVAAGSTATVTVTINLTAADKQWIDTYFPNGNYVEGYVYLEAEDEVTLSLPFFGFYGDWSDAPVFDTGYWYDTGFWDDDTGVTSPDTEEQANQFYHVPFVSMGTSTDDWVLGMSAYRSDIVMEDGSIRHDPSNNVLSPNGDGVLDGITDWYLSLMRNAKWVYLTYTDAQGNVLHEEALDYISKTMYNSNYGSVVPFVYSWYYNGLYDFTDADGNYLPHGTELTLTITACLDDGDLVVDDQMLQIPIYIDTEAPVMVGEPVESSDETGNYLTVTFREEHPAYVAVMNQTGTQIYNTYTEEYLTDNGDGTWSIAVDVTGLGEDFVVALCDYGCNESYHDVTYTLTDNVPVMDTTALYAYQLYDLAIHYNYGWDYMFGWSIIDKDTAKVEMISSDMYEYYALNAAEYAGGYVYAIDAGGNFLYMVPGIWNRHQICNLDLNVLDMSFDETTGTMYLISKYEKTTTSGTKNVTALYTIDLLTGELTKLKEYASSYDAPWAMTFANGTLYCCRYFASGLYTIDIAGGTYAMEAVLDADGEEYKPNSASGYPAVPQLLQSMTYSNADGVIYWAYYSGSSCELITIDPENLTSTATPMQYQQEYCGLLMLEDDGYTLPESEEISALIISNDRLILGKNKTETLEVSPLPWNAPMGQVTWTSSDASVATVDENGNVTGISAGDATITATVGDVSVTSSVTVVDISGDLNLYNYYSGDNNWGTWLNVDLATMNGYVMANSPVDFLSADYNGHDGLIYGYAENMYLYSYDLSTNHYTEIGKAHALVYDMAYDYSSGLMYAIVPDYNTWTTTLYYVNTLNGALVEAGVINDVCGGLACNLYGQLYVLTYDAKVYALNSSTMALTYIMDAPDTEVVMVQSMCYDHQNDALLWASAENSTIFLLDVNAAEPYTVDLGEPTETGSIEFVGLFVIPDEIPSLGYAEVDRIEADDLLILTETSRAPSITIHPLNATNQNVTYVSGDESVVRIENGQLVGVSVGSAEITAILADQGVEHTCTFTVTVKQNTDNISAYLMQDLSDYNGYCWIDIDDENPASYTMSSSTYYKNTYMTIYSAEYYDGKIYAYGYDDADWAANFHYFVIDAETGSLISAKDMGDEFPFVYDLSFDYTTGTMYALAGTSSASNLYMVNMATGQLILKANLGGAMYLSMAVDANGTIYVMKISEEILEMDSWYSDYEDAVLYTVNPNTGKCTKFMDVGAIGNKLASLCYDYDTGYLYWTGFGYALDSYETGLYLIDPADKTCTNLGTIGSAGSAVTGLMIRCDNYPQVPSTLKNLAITTSVVETVPGGQVQLETYRQPVGLDVEITWSSEDESIATVDENGLLTGVAFGATTVTATAVSGNKTFVATCRVVVYGEEDYFLTYNLTDGGFSTIDRPDVDKVTNLTTDEETDLVAMTEHDGLIYAYDAESNLYSVDPENGYQRTWIGQYSHDLPEDYVSISYIGSTKYEYDNKYGFEVRDLAWDPVNQRMLAIGRIYMDITRTVTNGSGDVTVGYDKSETTDGTHVFEVDLTTGQLTELCVIGDVWNSTVTGVQAMTITDDGEVYIYSTLFDNISKLDLTTGYVTDMCSLQNIGANGSSEGETMAMEYDPLTGNIYLMQTQNGSKYTLFKYDVSTTSVSRVGDIGLDGDNFAGLMVNTHEHTLVEDSYVEPTCEEDGYWIYVCTDCGREIHVADEGSAHGHTYEDGYCTECGASELALGDVNGDGAVDIRDAVLVASAYNEVITLTAEQKKRADVNGDGAVDIRDAVLIASRYNEIIAKFPAEE